MSRTRSDSALIVATKRAMVWISRQAEARARYRIDAYQKLTFLSDAYRASLWLRFFSVASSNGFLGNKALAVSSTSRACEASPACQKLTEIWANVSADVLKGSIPR